MIDLTPGMVVPCTIEKANPDMEAYFVRIHVDDLITNKFAVLLKKDAVRQYRAGEPLFAAVKKITKNAVFLSQYIPHYAIAMLNMVYRDEVKQYDIKFCRFGRIEAGKIRYCKVGIFGRAGLMSFEFLQSIALKRINEITKYIPTPYFIPGHQIETPKKSIPPNEKFVIEALRPAPVEKIIKYEYVPVPATEGYGEITLWVPLEYVPFFAGKRLSNMVTAFKMTSVIYTVIPVDTYLGREEKPVSIRRLVEEMQRKPESSVPPGKPGQKKIVENLEELWK